MRQHHPGEYAIVKQGDTRPYLIKISSADGDEVSGVEEFGSHIKALRNSVTVKNEEVILNLGSNPVPGMVHGEDLSTLWRGRKDHDKCGPVHFFYKPKKEVWTDLKGAMDKLVVKLNKLGLGFMLDANLIWEVMPARGKTAGMYIKSGKPEIPIRVQIMPEILPATEYLYVVSHEFGHHLHYNYCNTAKINAAWIKLYLTSIKLSDVKKSDSHDLLERLIAGEETPTDFKSNLEESEALTYKAIMRYIRQSYGLSPKELDAMFESGDRDGLKALWPNKSLTQKDLAPIITEYAAKNYKETIAESFAFYLVGKKLPLNVTKLLEKTISYAKTNRG